MVLQAQSVRVKTLFNSIMCSLCDIMKVMNRKCLSQLPFSTEVSLYRISLFFVHMRHFVVSSDILREHTEHVCHYVEQAHDTRLMNVDER